MLSNQSTLEGGMLRLGLGASHKADLWSSLDTASRLSDTGFRVAARDGAQPAFLSADAAAASAATPEWMHSVNGHMGAASASSPSGGPMDASGPGLTARLTQTTSGGHFFFSGDRDVDAVLIGSKWTGATVTFSFPTSGSFYGPAGSYYDPDFITTHAVFTAAQQTAARYAFAQIEAFTNLDMNEITETSTVHANLRLSQNNDDADNPSAQGNFPGSDIWDGDIWFGQNNQPFYLTPAPGNWGQATMMHEIGHSLGMKHGHDDYTSINLAPFYVDGPAPRFGTQAITAAKDGQAWSLMTYRSDPGAAVAFQGDGINQPQTYMQLDIAALQYMYGADFTFNGGATTYTFSPTTGEMFVNGVGQGAPSGNKVLRTIWDGDGIDTYDFSNYTGPQTIDLTPGAFSTFSTTQLVNHRPISGGPVLAPGNIANALLFGGDQRSMIENANGGSGADAITGNVVANVLRGNGGADTILGLDGADTIDGGDGTDAMYGGQGDDTISQNFGGPNETMDGGLGTDTGDWSYSGNNWIIDLGAGTAVLGATTWAQLVSIENATGGTGADTITGTNANNSLAGGDGADSLDGGNGTDTLTGGNGDDVLIQGFGGPNEVMDGGGGTDTGDWSYSVGDPWVIDLVAGTAKISSVVFANLTSIEHVVGGQGATTIIGDAQANRLDGQDGLDTLRGGAGADTLFGGSGDDLLQGGADNDSIDGGLGIDTLDYSDTATAVSVDLSSAAPQVTGGSGTDTIINVENLVGTNAADFLVGDGGANRITGGGQSDTIGGSNGNDTLDGGQGADSLTGGAADDVVLGGFGPDTMVGGSGIDTLDYSALSGSTVLDISNSALQNTGSGGGDILVGFENIITGAGADRLQGNGAANTIISGAGNDTIKAADGADSIAAGDNDDKVNGGGGADYILGGLGRDILRGAAGGDGFDFDTTSDSGLGLALCDQIKDFRTSDADKIDLSDVFAGVLTFIAGAAFSGVGAAEVRVSAIVGGALVQVDVNGDGATDMDIFVQGAGMTGGAGDFVL
jgi:serralysin